MIESDMNAKSDSFWMSRAIELASQAAASDEVPVGAVVVRNDELLGEGYNQPVSAVDPTAHAEIVAIRAASWQTGNYRLTGSTMYVTIEPCTMCVGALIHARIARVVYGAGEPRAGAIHSNLGLHDLKHFNHQFEVTKGVLEAECSLLMKKFFKARR